MSERNYGMPTLGWYEKAISRGERVMAQVDMFGGKEARDNALETVAGNAGEWMPRALKAIQNIRMATLLPITGTWTGEDIRIYVTNTIGPPHHHNAWGALIKAAITQKLIVPTGQYRPMKSKKSHARRTPVYRLKGSLSERPVTGQKYPGQYER